MCASPKSDHVRFVPTSCIILLLILAACSGGTATPPVMPSIWGAVIALGHAPQSGAPALWIDHEHFRAAWLSSDERGPLQVMRAGPLASPDDPESLTLPVFVPDAQTLLPAARDHGHLLWLDYASPDTSESGRHVWSAVVTPDLLIERGPLQLSERTVYRYSAAPAGDLAAWVVWSGGLPAEPDLFIVRIDPAGRPRLPDRLIRGGDWPALVTAAGELYLLWQRPSEGRLALAVLADGEPGDVIMPAPWLRLTRGDRLASFTAGADASHLYAFWTIVRADGQVETWWTHGLPESTRWPDPVPLQIEVISGTRFETGFNGGAALQAQDGNVQIEWSAPLRGYFDVLAVAAQVDDSLGVLYLREGEVAAFQPVVTLNSPGLIGPPALYTDRERHLYLAWSQPETDAATFYLTHTRTS